MKVGSLRWLEPSASRRWSSIRLSDVWLLVLRCFILILLAVALAKPVWEGSPTAQPAQKAVFISPELLHSSVLRDIKPTVDKLLQRGYTLHRFTPAFEAIPVEQWQAMSSEPTDSVVTNGNHWGLLPALAKRYDQVQDSVWLFTSDQQRHFTGTPAPLQENIRWVPVALEQSVNWAQAAYILPTDSLLLITGRSDRNGTTYQKQHFSRSGQSNTFYTKQARFTLNDSSIVAQWGNRPTQQVNIRKEPLLLGIVHDEAQQPEVRYLRAAVQAISGYTGIPIQFRQLTADAHPDTTAGWLFWLSSEEVPAIWLEQVQKKGTRLWVQSTTEPVATNAMLTSTGPENIKIRQFSTAGIDQATASTVWQTTTGEPLLTVQRLGLGKVYHFKSGFGPAWSQLGQSAQLPELLLPLLLPHQVANQFDARALDESQLKPAVVHPISKQDKQERQQYSLIPWLGLLTFLLFLAERIITTKRKTA